MNLFVIPILPLHEELVEPLVTERGISIERIISTGHSSPEGFWYDQKKDEWVALLQGEAWLSWENGKSLHMKSGDWVLIPAGERHRVDWTSEDPPCIWLAVHGKFS